MSSAEEQLKQANERIEQLQKMVSDLLSAQREQQERAAQQVVVPTSASRLPQGVKVAPPPPFKGAMDGDSVQNFCSQLENYFTLMGLRNPNMCARYAETLLVEKARTWFATQSYSLDDLEWLDLKSDLLDAFRPADFVRQARVQLSSCRQTSSDVGDYIARFNLAYNRTVDVAGEEAQFLFEQGLWSELQAQVLAQQPSSLSAAQEIAARVGGVLRSCGQFRKQGRFQYPPAYEKRDKHPKDSQYTKGSGSGHSPMVLGQATGQFNGRNGRQQGRRSNVTCYKCGKQGHIARECRATAPSAHASRGKANIAAVQQGGQGNSGKQAQQSLRDEVAELRSQLATVVNVLVAREGGSSTAPGPLNQ